MPIETTYRSARANLGALLRRVTDDQDIVVIKRRGKEDVALVPRSDLISLLETAYLLRSPANALYLLEAVDQSQAGQGHTMTVDELRREMGLTEGSP